MEDNRCSSEIKNIITAKYFKKRERVGEIFEKACLSPASHFWAQGMPQGRVCGVDFISILMVTIPFRNQISILCTLGKGKCYFAD